MDTEKLLKSLENEDNEYLLDLTTKKIRDMNKKVLHELDLTTKEMSEYLSKLKDYKYVDEVSDLKYGAYLRWISLTDPDDLDLQKGAIFCEVKVADDGLFLICRNYGYSRKHFRLKFDENLIFQKLSEQELILLNVLDQLAK
jgi:hypothetical protein